MNTKLSTFMTFAGSVAVGCGCAIAIASAAAVSQVAPSLRQHVQSAPVEVIRLEPVVVTVSKEYYDSVRAQDTALARANQAKKVSRG